jgi:Caspase domain
MRSVRAILITGDDKDSPGVPTPGATEAVNVMLESFATRFINTDVFFHRLGPAPTRPRVNDAFAYMRAVVRPGDLFVVMFAGHGSKATAEAPAQGWHLTERVTFTDIELADTLLAFPDGVDIVVISDCCYGRGFFKRGPAIVPPLDIELDLAHPVQHLASELHVHESSHTRRGSHRSDRFLGEVLGTIWDEEGKDSPMICISGAGKDKKVTEAHLKDLARETAEAASAGRTYEELNAVFDTHAVVNFRFHVDARPPARLGDRVLST